ncbi:hypothetical protein BUALT_Bualt19G0099400 [Buddleja alternifolia]|uniref:Squalene monooxygenase n=1 Tax=Buddleja alternifolia TaxID=168488 RepID=A0AAV6WA54_9LAMI|nr:hypothetical protein BUALT_Bualt19G0099400 [Buddleja alternifolia]
MQYLSANHVLIASPESKFCYFIGKKSRTKKLRIKNAFGESRSGINRCNDVIIVGAGVAGSALAFTLGKDGRQVQVIEKNLNKPDTFAGELLQPAGYLKLSELGLVDCVRDIDAQMVFGYAVYKDGKSVRLPYLLENYKNDVAGRGFRHGGFVQNLRAKAASLPNVKLEEGTVTSLIEEGGTIKGVQYKTSNGQHLRAYAPLTVVCDGCFSSLRKFLAKPKIDKPSHVVGLIVENCELPHPSHAHLVIANPSAFVLYPISSTEIRFLIDIPGPKLPSISNGQMATFLKTMVAPKVPPEMYSAFISSVDKGDIRTMPIRCMPAAPRHTPGALLLGDALNMRHALSGAGMTVALNDIALLCDLFKTLDLWDTTTVMKYTTHFYNTRKPMSFALNVLPDSAYKVIYSIPEELREKVLQAAFDYLSLEFSFTRELVGLISGLNVESWTTFLHVFATGSYVTGAMFLPVPSPDRVYAAARFASSAASIVIPTILDEGLGHLFYTESPPNYSERKTKQMEAKN